ncbi:DUF305 domain-containing protein [Aurantiacibacter gangjinensis]|uniref:DUF305 domain-containing protein n=1 Tax=Aurantiacibacter gangjinensis TaxID=502682 RepID=A0A0G9MMA4_9SPHN|nr:DUF305 domain-containing protein [Aurantiacibacter gangjinensis]APE27739.1 putative secreted protein [Aurantiacibacter gangjinensis]KLE31739.1 hypothetical protein AAW01_09530 [Aurantiacibacter gangjinensis]
MILRKNHLQLATSCSVAALLMASAASAQAQDVTIVQPGAVGEGVRVLSESEASRLAFNGYAPADVEFMQGMIVHHQQAVEMSQLVADRTNNEDVTSVSGRILSSQADEITFMREWLTERGERVEWEGMGHTAHMGMMGMATPAQMDELATLRGTAFDRMFLELMVRHHRGAIDMVRDLHSTRGTAADPVMYEFTSEVVNDQTSEIERMRGVLAGLSTDPRASLAAGVFDAGEAISNLRHVAFLRKPAGFFDPENPAGLRPEILPEEEDEEAASEADESAIHANHAAMTAAAEAEGGQRHDHQMAMAEAEEAAEEATDAEANPEEEAEEPQRRFAQRGGPLSFSQTDIAFSGDLMVTGNYHGWNAYRLGEDGMPTLVSSVVCPGGQGDVSIAGDLLIMSVEDTRGRVDCGSQGVTERVSDERFRGLRIFDISDITRPVQVGQVQTCRGSHTHSIVQQNEDALIVYNSGTGSVRETEELAICFDDEGGDDRTSLFRIDVIEIPLDDPSQARITSSPAVFADPETGRLAGLWTGGDHGDETQETRRTDQCHDITVFPSLNLAAGACSGNGIIFDISDPYNPTRLDAVTDPGFAYWHSATFNNTGDIVLFTDEWGGGGRPRCQAADPRNWGANAFYAIVDGQLEYRGTFKLPAPQGETENCVAHNGSIIPVPGRNIFVQAWYQGGLSVIDFTDPTNPFEIAYFDRGPVDEDQLVTGGYWSTYFYNGRIYATEIARGLDVFALEPSEYLTAEEIAAAEAASFQDNVFNPQTQYPVTWSEDVIRAVEDSRNGG